MAIAPISSFSLSIGTATTVRSASKLGERRLRETWRGVEITRLNQMDKSGGVTADMIECTPRVFSIFPLDILLHAPSHLDQTAPNPLKERNHLVDLGIARQLELRLSRLARAAIDQVRVRNQSENHESARPPGKAGAISRCKSDPGSDAFVKTELDNGAAFIAPCLPKKLPRPLVALRQPQCNVIPIPTWIRAGSSRGVKGGNQNARDSGQAGARRRRRADDPYPARGHARRARLHRRRRSRAHRRGVGSDEEYRLRRCDPRRQSQRRAHLAGCRCPRCPRHAVRLCHGLWRAAQALSRPADPAEAVPDRRPQGHAAERAGIASSFRVWGHFGKGEGAQRPGLLAPLCLPFLGGPRSSAYFSRPMPSDKAGIRRPSGFTK